MSTRLHYHVLNRKQPWPEPLCRWTEFFPRYGHPSFEVDAFLTAVCDWCDDHFGTGGHFIYPGADVRIDSNHRWVLMGINILIRDPDDALVFKLRWG